MIHQNFNFSYFVCNVSCNAMDLACPSSELRYRLKLIILLIFGRVRWVVARLLSIQDNNSTEQTRRSMP